jgi:hypothetical protein
MVDGEPRCGHDEGDVDGSRGTVKQVDAAQSHPV